MAGNTKILFLYSLVQPYLLAGIASLAKNYNTQVLVYRWKTSNDAPLAVTEINNVRIEEKRDVEAMRNDIKKFQPDIVYIAGWMDADYWRFTKTLHKQAKVVMGIDNQWFGNVKQRINCLFDPLGIHKRIHYAWVPGYQQYEYAGRLGFKASNILTGLYTTDTQRYETAFLNGRLTKENSFPHSFLYVGRLVEHKFGNVLRAFTSFESGELKDWELTVVGRGDMAEHALMQNQRIKYHGFVQPEDLPGYAEKSGVFCLLSSDEPYGMVIPEFAMAGMPLFLTHTCGAAKSYLIDGYNGFLVRELTVDAIRKKMLEIVNSDDTLLNAMGVRSHDLAIGRTSDTWAATLMSVLN